MTDAGGDPELSQAGGMGSMEKFIIALLLTAAAGITIFFFAGESLIHRDQVAKPITEPGIPLVPPPSPMAPAALKALEAYFEAPDLEAKALLVRGAARVRPMFEDYHRTRGKAFPTLNRVSPGIETHTGEMPVVLFEVEPFSGPRYPVAVVWDGQKFAVDWESLTAYGTMDWNEFIEKKPAALQTMRVFAEEAPDSEKPPGLMQGSACFRINHRDDGEPIVAIASPEVVAAFPPMAGRKEVPVTLEIAWRPQGGRMAPEIVRLVSLTWSP